MHIFLIRLNKNQDWEESKKKDFTEKGDRFAKTFFTPWSNPQSYACHMDGISLYSWYTHPDFCKRNYISFDENQKELIGYAGAPVGKGISTDYRSASSFSAVQPTELMGQYTFFTMRDRFLKLYGDNIGYHTLFYYRNPEDNAIYISNTIKLLKLTKKRNINLDFFIEMYALGGEFWGNHTEDLDINALGEYARVTYDNGSFSLDTYSDYRSVIGARKNGTTQDYLKQAAERFNQASEYIEKYHRCAIGLSGGFDSRLVLSMFINRSLNDSTCFTFHAGHGKREKRISQQLARFHGLPFHFIDFSYSDLPTIHEFNDESKALGWDFRQLTYIIPDAIYKNSAILDSQERVLQPTGTCGDVGTARYAGIRPTVSQLLNWRININALNPDIKNDFFAKKEAYFKNRFGDFDQEISDAYLFFENCQSSKFAYTQYQQRRRDYFQPLISTEFMNLCFSMEPEQRLREIKGSPHNLLLETLTNGNYPTMGFDKHPHWDSNALVRMGYSVDVLKKRILKRFFSRKDYFTNMRVRFVLDNRDIILDTIQTHKNSEFIKSINNQWISKIMDAPTKMVDYYKEVSCLVPILNYLDD